MSSSPLVVPALGKHTATIIMAHGLGDSGQGWISLAENWRRRGKFQDVKFIFPHAPMIPITVNGGFRMRGWHDITSFSELSSEQDRAGILRSRDYLASLITTETNSTPSVPSHRIILGGFSQGGALALFTALTTPIKLGGAFGLSSYLVLADKIKEHEKDGKGINRGTPVFMGHGDQDPLVRYEWGKRTADGIRKLGYNVDFKTYEGLEHSAALEEIDDLEVFITKCLKNPEAAASNNTASSSSATETSVGNPGI